MNLKLVKPDSELEVNIMNTSPNGKNQMKILFHMHQEEMDKILRCFLIIGKSTVQRRHMKKVLYHPP